MKKLKEFLLFVVTFIVLTFLKVPWLYFILSLNGSGKVILPENFIKVILSDVQFLKAVFSLFLRWFAISFVFVAIFVVLMFLLRNKFRFRRRFFYTLCIATGFTPCLIAFCISWIIIYAHNPSVANSSIKIAVGGWTLYALQASLLAAFVVWLVELIAEKIKHKRNVMPCEED